MMKNANFVDSTLSAFNEVFINILALIYKVLAFTRVEKKKTCKNLNTSP